VNDKCLSAFAYDSARVSTSAAGANRTSTTSASMPCLQVLRPPLATLDHIGVAEMEISFSRLDDLRLPSGTV